MADSNTAGCSIQVTSFTPGGEQQDEQIYVNLPPADTRELVLRFLKSYGISTEAAGESDLGTYKGSRVDSKLLLDFLNAQGGNIDAVKNHGGNWEKNPELRILM